MAPCKVETKNGVSKIILKGATLQFNDLKVGDGEYFIKLLPEKLGFVYNRKYAKNNKITQATTEKNLLAASAYDEDKIGNNKNTVFVKVKGFDDYVVAILDDVFSVYKMPKFSLLVKEDSFKLIKK